MPELNFADVLSPIGFVTTAAFVTGLVEVLKRILPGIGDRKLEQALAALVTALLVAGAVFVALDELVEPLTLAGTFGLILTAVAAWYGILRIALGIHDDVAQKPDSLTGPAADEVVDPVSPVESP